MASKKNHRRITGNRLGAMLCEVLGLDPSHVMEIHVHAEWGTVASYTVTYAMTQQQAEDIVGMIETTEDTVGIKVNDTPKEIKKPCNTCSGTGALWDGVRGHVVDCHVCEGSGNVTERRKRNTDTDS